LFSEGNLVKVYTYYVRKAAYQLPIGEIVAGERLVRVRDGNEWITYFDSKNSYLEWVAEWKKVWKIRSEEQKKLRIKLSQPHSIYGYNVGDMQAQRMVNKQYLRMLLYARRYAKRTSQQMKKEAVLVS
jgi:hypothetical protein